MERFFIDKIPDGVSNYFDRIIQDKLDLFYIASTDRHLLGSVIQQDSSIIFSGLSDVTLYFKKNDQIGVLPLFFNYPSKKLDYSYQYSADIFNVKFGKFSIISLLDFVELKAAGIVYFDAPLALAGWKRITLTDEHRYKERGVKREIIQTMDIDMGIVLDFQDGKHIVIHVSDDKSLLNIRYCLSDESLNLWLDDRNVRIYDAKLSFQGF